MDWITIVGGAVAICAGLTQVHQYMIWLQEKSPKSSSQSEPLPESQTQRRVRIEQIGEQRDNHDGQIKKLAQFVPVVLLLLLGCRQYLIFQLPVEKLPLLSSAIVEEEPPWQPGTQSIVLIGAQIQQLRFRIDPTYPGMQPIDFGTLSALVGGADQIILRVPINDEGEPPDDISRIIAPRGLPAGVQYAISCVRTWKFTPYKKGTIEYIISVGAVGGDTIDPNTGGMRINRENVGDNSVTDGLLYLVQNQ